MLSNITIGQYFPGKSFVHKLDPRTKILLTIAYIVVLFCVRSPISFVLAIIYVFSVVAIAKIPIKVLLKSIKPILPLILFTAVLNMLFVTGKPILSFWIINITAEGIELALLMAFRIVCLILGASLLTYTTSAISLTDAIESLFKPLKIIRFPVHEMAMMMTIALRFIPTLLEETDKIMSAQKARGADLETGGLIKRAKALIPILIPLFISSFRRAEELALAMECRCYRGGEGRTRLNSLKFSKYDILGFLFASIIFSIFILVNVFLPNFLSF